MQSIPIPPNIAGGLYPTAAAQSSPGPKQGQQGQTQPQSIAPSSQDVSDTNQGRASKQQESSSSKQSQSSEQELSQSERARLSKLQQRDREVRAHEQAHVAAGGPYVQGGANLETRLLGPDRQFYAVGGEVSMDASKVPGDPEATVVKARTLRRAALAPARPSGQDLQVAAQA
ncbi:MAG: putative metalloprotease CJM1_0395 family protein, partial [Desulfohalobiaceae bacterium]